MPYFSVYFTKGSDQSKEYITCTFHKYAHPKVYG